MRTVLTAKLKWHTTPERFCALRAAQLAYHDALNSLNPMSRSTFAVGKLSNAMGWQDGTYHDIRSRRDLPAPIPCSVPRQVDATYQTLWTAGAVDQGHDHRCRPDSWPDEEAVSRPGPRCESMSRRR